MTASIPDLMRSARRAEETLARIVTTLAADLERIEDEAYSTLRAQSFEPAEGTVSLWCRTHDQSLLRCENQDRDGCEVGPHLDEGPGKSDPTGEAVDRSNPAKGVLAQVRRDLEALERLTGHLAGLVRAPETVDGAVLAVAGRQAAGENAKGDGPGCSVCAKSGNWSKIHEPEKGRPLGPTDVGGRLDEEITPCTFHYRFARDHGRLPNDYEERRHQEKRRVTVRHDPTEPAKVKGIGVQFDRLSNGIQTGKL